MLYSDILYSVNICEINAAIQVSLFLTILATKELHVRALGSIKGKRLAQQLILSSQSVQRLAEEMSHSNMICGHTLLKRSSAAQI